MRDSTHNLAILQCLWEHLTFEPVYHNYTKVLYSIYNLHKSGKPAGSNSFARS